MARKMTAWNKHLARTMKLGRSKDKSFSLGDAMKEASASYKKMKGGTEAEALFEKNMLAQLDKQKNGDDNDANIDANNIGDLQNDLQNGGMAIPKIGEMAIPKMGGMNIPKIGEMTIPKMGGRTKKHKHHKHKHPKHHRGKSHKKHYKSKSH